ncbi:MAG: aldo/keto reductase [Haloferacaceae archaeon]
MSSERQRRTSSPSAEDCPTTSEMPMLGLGTWENTDDEACIESVATALEMGYRHVDTAQAYGNEELVGEGIARAGVDREDVFLATKVWIDSLDYDSAVESTHESLERLGVDAVDLLYVHWPARAFDWAETFDALSELVAEGATDRVAVSNFEPDQLERAVAETDVEIFANQVEIHPLLPQRELREAAAELDVELVAYSPLARGDVFDHPTVSEVAERHGVSEARVSLAWLRHHDITAIPKATGEEHVRDNWESLELELTAEDVEALDGIEDRDRKVDPSFAPW